MGQRLSMSHSFLDKPNWHLQSKRRVEPQPSLLNTGGFLSWTNVPPVGTSDPYNADEQRSQRRMVNRPRSGHQPNQIGGRLHVQPQKHDADPAEGKRTFPTTRVQSAPPRASGVRRVHMDHPALANPNAAGGGCAPARSAGVKTINQNAAFYRIWNPGELNTAEWKPGVRIARDAAGRHMRALERPMAWPADENYPPCRDASGALVDYALAFHGGAFRTMPKDVLDSRQSHRNTSARPNQQMRCRHAGERYY